jgi:hypothetical protein
MRLFPTAIAVLSMLVAHTVCAQIPGQPQATPPPLAPGPLLNRAPGLSQWLVSITTGSDNIPEIPDAQTKYDERTLVTKSDPIRYEITLKTGGEKFEKWYVGSMVATVVPGVPTPSVSPIDQGLGRNGAMDFSATDFPGFEWLSRKTYIGVQNVEGVDCIVFHTNKEDGYKVADDTPPIVTGTATAPPQSGSTAYIAEEGRLPVLLIVGPTVTFYQFRATPSALALPPAVADAFAQQEARLRQLSAPAAAP